MTCNCGREDRYMHSINDEWVMSCNKHVVCPPYAKLEEACNTHFDELLEVISCAEDLLCFREGTDYYEEAERRIMEIKTKYTVGK